MIDISNATADEITLVISELRRMAEDIPGNRAANMRRRGARIIRYLSNKKIKHGKKKEDDNDSLGDTR